MRINYIGRENSVLNRFLSEIRDVNTQRDGMRFRRNVEPIGEILCYELSKKLRYEKEEVITPLGIKTVNLPPKDIVLCSILRAGIPLHKGVLNYFDDAENAFISAYRHRPNHHTKESEIIVEYFASPTIEDKTLILIDPMLATGHSLVSVYAALRDYGQPKELHIIVAIGSLDGIDFIKNHVPQETYLWIGDIDHNLNEKGYIVPGLGDAGDLAYGKKM